MTQRIFDVDNPQDVKDLFDILPDKVKTVIQDSIDSEEIELYGKDGGYIDSCAHIRVNWRDKTFDDSRRPNTHGKTAGGRGVARAAILPLGFASVPPETGTSLGDKPPLTMPAPVHC